MALDVKIYYETYGPMVLRRCRRLLTNEDAARDAMQDVFVQLIRNEKRLKDEYPSSLLYRMATNVCLNIIRSKKRKPEVSADERVMAIARLEEPEKGWLARDILEKLFGRGRESTRTIAVLHLADGLTLEETAREVGLSVSGVRKRLRKLRADVQKMEEAGHA